MPKRRHLDNQTYPVTTGGAGYIPDSFGLNGINLIRQRLYDNIIPFGYNAPLDRVYNAVVKNKKEHYNPAYGVLSDTAETLDALWGQYLNIPNDKRHEIDNSNGIVRSAGPDNKEYYQLKNLDPIIDEVVSTGLGWNERIQKIPGKSPWVTYYHTPIKLGEKVSSNTQNQILGEYQIGRGYDNRGEYLSYEDVWDINPFQKTVNTYGQDDIKNDGLLQKVVRLIAPKQGDASFGIGSPVNIYGKIYLDDLFGINNPTHATYLPEVTVYSKRKKPYKASFKPRRSLKSGGAIHIDPANRGKFNATKERTGKTTEELTHSKNPLTRKRAIFAQNAAKWNH